MAQSRNPKPTCSFKLHIYSFYMSNWNRRFLPPMTCDSTLYWGRKINIFLFLPEVFPIPLLRHFPDVTSNQFWMARIKGIPPQIQLSAICWRWYERNVGPSLYLQGTQTLRSRQATQEKNMVKSQTLQHRGLQKQSMLGGAQASEWDRTSLNSVALRKIFFL